MYTLRLLNLLILITLQAQTGKLVLNNELTEDSLQITVESIKSTDEAVSRPVGKDIYLYSKYPHTCIGYTSTFGRLNHEGLT